MVKKPHIAPPGSAANRIAAVLEQYRAEARCANELERGHVLWRLGQELGLSEEALLGRGFETAYRHIVED